MIDGNDWLRYPIDMGDLQDLKPPVDKDDFYPNLEAYVDGLPNSRESAETLMDMAEQYDNWHIYVKLLFDCEAFLKPEELRRIRNDYKRIFDIPLPGDEE